LIGKRYSNGEFICIIWHEDGVDAEATLAAKQNRAMATVIFIGRLVSS